MVGDSGRDNGKGGDGGSCEALDFGGGTGGSCDASNFGGTGGGLADFDFENDLRSDSRECSTNDLRRWPRPRGSAVASATATLVAVV